ncbi:sigma-54 interaction domain-containing protein [Persephonella sp.]
MTRKVHLLAKNSKVIEKFKKLSGDIIHIDDPKKIKNVTGVIFVNISDFGIVPVETKKGLFPVAVLDKNLSKTNLAAFIMRIMSKNYFDYIEFPITQKDYEELLKKIDIKEEGERKIIQFRNSAAKDGLLCQYLCSIIGSSPQLKEICKLAGEVAPTDLPVLITGETGTGKELLAKGIWKLSKRSNKPFIAINCAAIPENLLESELFGYEKGAFTGAEKTKMGKFELADGGTIFLDEIGDLPLPAQSKLLRVLQEGTFYRVGGTKEIKIDVRVMAATNKNLEEMVSKGEFREDLYYRLNFIHLHLPPLRERKEDIPYIVECIVNKYNQKLNKNIIGASKEYIDILKEQKWEGNIRELENTVVRSMILCRDNILTPSDLTFIKEKTEKKEKTTSDGNFEELLKEKIKASLENGEIEQIKENIEKIILQTALEYTKHNQVKASKLLGINRATLRKKIQKFGL